MRHNRATRPGLYLCARDYAAIVLRSIALLAPVRYVAVRCSTLRVVGHRQLLSHTGVACGYVGIGIGRNSPQRLIYIPGPARTATGWKQRGGLCWAVMVEGRRWGEAD